ncbi:hypothetical protein [Aliamphritea spongicola]
MIQHVVNHTSYHRGHIEGVFYQLGLNRPPQISRYFCGITAVGSVRA